MTLKYKKIKFSLLFDKHYTKLYRYSIKVLKDNDIASELVQETFIKLWNNFDSINDSERSVESYLIVTLKNNIIDNYRKTKVREKHTNQYILDSSILEDIDNQWEIIDLIKIIYSSLHPNTVQIFKLSRDKGLTYKEIADKKNISIKTVESHISKALIVFRKYLKDYL
ncbi:MAG TPA: hypothetical protein DDZ39_03400 [Flavobacteriaceae bacterium]|jgi:RNA polymerase sigma-70 factor (ECF subfamily)|nr:hypothetical protein [Flavobacteriaceae bacterium]HBS11322.1 hypothetical protein [Flavobacteriaceae bacterium]